MEDGGLGLGVEILGFDWEDEQKNWLNLRLGKVRVWLVELNPIEDEGFSLFDESLVFYLPLVLYGLILKYRYFRY